MTVEDAAIRYVKAHREWKQAIERHKHSLETYICEHQLRHPSNDVEGSKRCFEVHPPYDPYDGTGGDYSHHCEGCRKTYEFYQERCRFARYKGAAHAVLIKTARKQSEFMKYAATPLERDE